MQQIPFWSQQAKCDQHLAQAAIKHDQQVDVCIIGGGYTGLWTAIELKQRSPELSIAIIEKDFVGSGASGRNGGCMLTFSTKYQTLARLYGEQEAVRLIQASEQAPKDIETFCKKHDIDAEVRVDGTLYFSSNQAQMGSLSTTLDQLAQKGINHWQDLPVEQAKKLAASDACFEGHYSPNAGSLHPGKLVNGLKKVVLDLGVHIYENTSMTRIESDKNLEYSCKVVCAAKDDPNTKISINAKKLVIATGAHAPSQFKRFQRTLVLVSSDMLITKPNPQWLKNKGLTDGRALIDNNTFVHYYRTTEDGRLMLGKGGNRFSFGNQMRSCFDQPSAFKDKLIHSFKSLFNQTPDIEQTWCGASDRSVSGLPFFGRFKENHNIVYGLGYSGNGVIQTHLGGKFLASLVLDENNEWTQSAMAKGPVGKFPAEPIRTLGANIVKHAITRQERKQYANQPVDALTHWLASLANAAGKADK